MTLAAAPIPNRTANLSMEKDLSTNEPEPFFGTPTAIFLGILGALVAITLLASRAGLRPASLSVGLVSVGFALGVVAIAKGEPVKAVLRSAVPLLLMSLGFCLVALL